MVYDRPKPEVASCVEKVTLLEVMLKTIIINIYRPNEEVPGIVPLRYGNFLFLMVSFLQHQYLSTYYMHIFQKAQVTLNEMEPKKRHHFLAQFFTFSWCGSFLFEMLAIK